MTGTDHILRGGHVGGHRGQRAGHPSGDGQQEDEDPDQRPAGQPGRGRPIHLHAVHVGSPGQQHLAGLALRAGHLQGQHVCTRYVCGWMKNLYRNDRRL